MKEFLRKAASVAIMWGLVLALGYFAFALLFGGSSVFTLTGRKAEETQKQAALDAVQSDRKAVEDKVVRLRPKTLDWDLAEEEAVKALGERVRKPAQDTAKPDDKKQAEKEPEKQPVKPAGKPSKTSDAAPQDQ